MPKKNSIKTMLAPYAKRYIRFSRVEEAERTLVFATLIENNGREELALSASELVTIILKASIAGALFLPAGVAIFPRVAAPIISPFKTSFFPEYKIPHFSYARPPTQ